MSVLLAAALAAAAVAVLVAVPRPAQLRFGEVAAAPRARRGRWVPRPVPALGLAGAAALLAGPAAAGLSLLGLVAGLRWDAARRRRLGARAERAGMLEACGVLSAELSSGRPPAAALAAAADVSVGPARRALASAAAAAELGGDVAGALTSEAAVSAIGSVLRSLAACWAVCSASGSGLAAAVQRLEDGLRAEAAQRRAVEAELAGPRATAALLAGLPGVGLLMGVGLGADPLHVLLRTPLGLVCLVLGLGLDGLGALWTARLVARAGGAA